MATQYIKKFFSTNYRGGGGHGPFWPGGGYAHANVQNEFESTHVRANYHTLETLIQNSKIIKNKPF